MPKQSFDPLTFLPSPEAIQKRLDETEVLARRLRILLQVAAAVRDTDKPTDLSETREVGHAQ